MVVSKLFVFMQEVYFIGQLPFGLFMGSNKKALAKLQFTLVF